MSSTPSASNPTPCQHSFAYTGAGVECSHCGLRLDHDQTIQRLNDLTRMAREARGYITIEVFAAEVDYDDPDSPEFASASTYYQSLRGRRLLDDIARFLSPSNPQPGT